MLEINEDGEEYDILVTRATTYGRPQIDNATSTPQRKSGHKNNYIACKEHSKQMEKGCEECIYLCYQGVLPHGRLPTLKQVISYILHVNMNNFGKNNYADIASDIMIHWISCNIYTITRKAVLNKIEQYMKIYKDLLKYPRSKKGETYYTRVSQFKEQCNCLFDIKCTDPARINVQEKLYGVRMSDDDKQFYINQTLQPQVGYCSTSVDRKWLKTAIRRNAERTRIDAAQNTSNCNSENINFEDSMGLYDSIEVDEIDTSADFMPETKKVKYELNSHCEDIPECYRQVRYGPRSVRPEIYNVMQKLSAEFHMSRSQIEGSIVTIANLLFGLNWKCFQDNEEGDLYTLPSMRNMAQIETHFEAMALCSIVEEIMQDDTATTVTYSNDGSAMSGVGSYVVQSLNVNGVQRALPTFSIFTESRNSLKDLEITTLRILAASSGHKYSEQDILKRISFVMTDSTSHNKGVIELVCQELNVEQIPATLLCNVHPLMMFQGKIKELCQEIHDLLGNKKINDCFMVDVEFKSESFIIKSIKCLSNFINRDYSAKPWNRYNHFAAFIKPKENKAISLKDHRFNRLNDCALSLIYHLDDIANYLEQYTNIINGISILDRSFIEIRGGQGANWWNI